jgi:undecaprenyl-diphosphatase
MARTKHPTGADATEWGESAILGQVNPATDVNLVQGLFQAFILGIVQGLTEFLPISSTAHLEVFTKALHWKTVGGKPFLATIQFGSVVAVLIYFWKDITKIFTGGLEAIRQKDWQREEWKIIVGIAVGTLPILVGGFLLKDALNDEKSPINSMTTIASRVNCDGTFAGISRADRQAQAEF